VLPHEVAHTAPPGCGGLRTGSTGSAVGAAHEGMAGAVDGQTNVLYNACPYDT
jgi:hypothetical protein